MVAPAVRSQSEAPTVWAGIIRDIAARVHGGHYYPMAKRLGASIATIYQWRDGIIRQPQPATIVRVCEVYGLDLAVVWPRLYAMPPTKAPKSRASPATSYRKLLRQPGHKIPGPSCRAPQALVLQVT